MFAKFAMACWQSGCRRASAAMMELTAAGLLYNAKAKATYYKALGSLSKEQIDAAEHSHGA